MEEEICIIEINETEKKKSIENSPLLHNFRTMTPEQIQTELASPRTSVLINNNDNDTLPLNDFLHEDYELNFIHYDSNSDNYEINSRAQKNEMTLENCERTIETRKANEQDALLLNDRFIPIEAKNISQEIETDKNQNEQNSFYDTFDVTFLFLITFLKLITFLNFVFFIIKIRFSNKDKVNSCDSSNKHMKTWSNSAKIVSFLSSIIKVSKRSFPISKPSYSYNNFLKNEIYSPPYDIPNLESKISNLNTEIPNLNIETSNLNIETPYLNIETPSSNTETSNLNIEIHNLNSSNFSLHPPPEHSNDNQNSPLVVQNNVPHLRCLYTNATSLNQSKLSELATISESENIHILFITETWFTSESVVNLPNFNVFRSDRASHGGGVGIYINNKFSVNELNCMTNSHSEQLWLCVETNKESTIIGCIYRPPDSNLERSVSDASVKEIHSNISLAKKLIDNKKYGGLMIAGDFNFPSIKWYGDYAEVLSSESSYASLFYDMLNNESLTQNVSFPTFLKSNGDLENTLDLIISDTPERVSSLEHHPPLGDSNQGHLILLYDYLLSNKSTRSTSKCSKFNYKRGDYDSFNSEINKIDWTSLFYNTSIEDGYSKFLFIYNKTCISCIPKINLSNIPKFNNPWMSKDLLKLIRLKKKLFYRNLSSKWKIPELVTQYKNIRSKVKKQTHITIAKFELNLANDKKNPKKLFKYINSRQKVISSISSLSDNGTNTSDRFYMANILNNQFKSVFNVDSDNHSFPSFNQQTSNSFSSINISYDLVLSFLESLDPCKSIGTDGVHPHVLKFSAASLAVPLTLIFKASLKSGSIPSLWSEAIVTPLFKKGKKTDAANYRPISLTSVVCKVMEKIVKKSLMEFLNKNELISIRQHGFVNNKACITNLLEGADLVTKNLAEKNSVDLLLLDFAKAFDKVPHNLLEYKLKKFGINGDVLNWITAFLSNRKQRVVLGDATSDWTNVTSGVIQGSVLGPTLFIIYINDLSDCCRFSFSSSYADDTKMFIIIRDDHYLTDTLNFQSDINCAVEWTKSWKMELNLDKCKIIHFGKNNQHNIYVMKASNSNDIIPINKSNLESDLGILISSNMKPTQQCNKAASKGNRMLGLMKRTFQSNNSFVWKKLYTTYIRPQLEYAVSAWNPFLLKDIRTIEKVQRRSTKKPHTHKGLSYPIRCSNWNITSLEKRRLRGDLIQKFKFFHGYENINWFSNPCNTPPRGGHRGFFIREIVKNCNERFHFFNNRIAGPWNSLPDDIVYSIKLTPLKPN